MNTRVHWQKYFAYDTVDSNALQLTPKFSEQAHEARWASFEVLLTKALTWANNRRGTVGPDAPLGPRYLIA